jgi:hypothetical protein
MCGEEVCDTPLGSLGDTLCRTLVEPAVPCAFLAALPLLIAGVGGFVGIRVCEHASLRRVARRAVRAPARRRARDAGRVLIAVTKTPPGRGFRRSG